MSFGIQTQTTITLSELNFFATDTEEVAEQEGEQMPLTDSKGGLKTPTKHYSLTPKETASFAKEIQHVVCSFKFVELPKPGLEKSPFMSLSSSYRPTKPREEHQPMAKETKQEQHMLSRAATEQQPKTQAREKPHEAPTLKQEIQPTQTPKAASSLKEQPQVAREGVKNSSSRSQEKAQHKQQERNGPLASRLWVKEETKQWWEARYHQRERQGGQHRQDQEQHQEKDEKKLRISKSANASSKNPSSAELPKDNNAGKVKKPELAPPRIGVFALYYILTKMGIVSDGTSNYFCKKEIEIVDAETTEAHKKRLEEMKEAIKKEKETERWGVAVQVFSWIAAVVGVIAGILLIATGVGAVAGALMVAGGIIQIASQIMETTGGWKKVAEILPGEDTEKKRAVITWMQIGIGVLCLVLAGAGIIWGGFASFGKAMTTAMGMIGAIQSIGYGVTQIGEGVSGFFWKSQMAEISRFDITLIKLKTARKDLLEKVEWGIDRLEQLFEDLARSLEFEEELFQADQMIHQR